MRRGGRLDLSRAYALSGYLHGVVAPAVDVPKPVVVGSRPVALDPDVREAPPVRRQVALVGVPEAPPHARPRFPHDEFAYRPWHPAHTLVAPPPGHAAPRPPRRST